MLDMASNRFFNLLQKQIFIDEEKYTNKSHKAIRNNDALKFVVNEKDLKEYFNERYISLSKYLNTENLEYKTFYVTNKICTANYLYNELTYQDDAFLILFNSNLHNREVNSTFSAYPIVDNPCYYLDDFSNTFYFTVKCLFLILIRILLK